MSVPTTTTEDCVQAAESFAMEITRVTGFDLATGSEVGRPCFRDFGLTDDIREEFGVALELMSKGKLNECLWTLQRTRQHLDNKRGAYLRATVIQRLTDFAFQLAMLYVRDEKIERVRVLVRQFEQKYMTGVADLDIASRDYWEIFDLCEILKEEKAKEAADESRAAREKAEKANEVHIARCRETADQIRERFPFLMVA